MAKATLLFARRLSISFFLLIVSFTFVGTKSLAYLRQQQTDGLAMIAPGAPVEQEISRGQTHSYSIQLEAGQFIEIILEQRGMDIAAKLIDPAGKPVFREDRVFGIYGAEEFAFVAEATGLYRLEIVEVGEGVESGRYSLKTTEPRPASGPDRIKVSAETAFREARQMSHEFRSRRDRDEMHRIVAKYEESIALWQTLGNKVKEREVLCGIGGVYLPMNELVAAQEIFERALALIEGDEGFSAADINNLGFLYNKLGVTQKALKYYQQALAMRRLNKERLSEGVTLDNLGQVYRRMGEMHLALEHHLEALHIFRELKRRKSEGIALSNIANIYHQIGESTKAIEYAQVALTIAREENDKTEAGIRLHNIGAYYLELGNLREAKEYLDKALELDRSTNNIFNQAYDLATLGKIHLTMDEPGVALDYLDQAMSIHQKIGNHVGIAQTLIGIGMGRERLGDMQKAIAAYEEALGFYKRFGNPDAQSELLNNLATLHRKLGNPAQARRLLEEAIELAESVRAKAKSQQSRLSYLAKKQSVYAEYTDLLMEMHKAEPGRGYEVIALQNSERARARSLLDLLAEAQANIRQGADPSLLAEEKSIRERLSAKGQEQTRLFTQQPNKAKEAALAKEIANLMAEWQQIEARIRVSSPKYAALTRPQPLTSAQIQQLLDEETLLLEFALGDEQSWVWAVTKTAVSSHRLPPRREIEQATRRVYELLTARQPKKGETEAQWQARITDADSKLSQETVALSRLLLGPLSSQLNQQWRGRRLLIVASGALEYLPFGILTLPGEQNLSQPLIAFHEIVNLPSATVLSVLRQEAAGRQPAPKSVAVLADPVFESNDPRVLLARKRQGIGSEIAINTRSVSSNEKAGEGLTQALKKTGRSTERGGFSRLPFSREEADAISSLVPSSDLLKATDFEASNSKVLSGELSKYRIIPFATHGLLNSEQPERSGLVLSLIDESGKYQDGFLPMHEIYNLHLPADMVVLSACQTGLGKEFKGEGLVGLTRGFMYAGAQRVVASLWQVDDLATAELMERFYKGMLKEGLPAAAALRAAQLELMKDKRWSSPYFWAGFVLQGEWK